MTNFNYPLQKWFRTVSFSLLLVAGCFLNTTLFAQNREIKPQANHDIVTGADPLAQYISNNKTNPMVIYYLENPGDMEVVSIIKMKAFIDNPAAIGKYQASDIEQMKTSLYRLQFRFLESIQKSPEANNKQAQKLTGEQARIAASQQAKQSESKQALIKYMTMELNSAAVPGVASPVPAAPAMIAQ